MALWSASITFHGILDTTQCQRLRFGKDLDQILVLFQNFGLKAVSTKILVGKVIKIKKNVKFFAEIKRLKNS